MKTRPIIKAILIIAVVLVTAFVGFLIWLSRNPIVLFGEGPGKHVAASVVPDAAAHTLTVAMQLSGTQRPHTVTEISMPRTLAQALGVRPPNGFSEQFLPLDDRSKNNPDMVKSVEKFNQDTLRWVGALPLPPGDPVSLTISSQTPLASTGTISFQYEWKGKVLGASISFFDATLTNQ